MGTATISLTRRAFLQGNALILLGGATGTPLSSAWANPPSECRFGMLTDLHYADKPPAGTRHYRETLAKLAEAAEIYRKEKPEFMVELGDIVDAASSVSVELEYLKRVNKDFAAIHPQRHYVLGNHCVDTLTKEEFLDTVEQKRSFYAFDHAGYHYIILDACFRSDGKPYGRKNSEWTDPNISAAQLDWLREDLKATTLPTVVFIHQRLDVSNHYGVKNAAAVRTLLEDSSRVLAVFQGHSHKNDYKEIAGIHYCTLAAMIEGSGPENNSYSMVTITPESTITVTGFRQQKGYRWARGNR